MPKRLHFPLFHGNKNTKRLRKAIAQAFTAGRKAGGEVKAPQRTSHSRGEEQAPTAGRKQPLSFRGHQLPVKFHRGSCFRFIKYKTFSIYHKR
jgi:hypothetical protein